MRLGHHIEYFISLLHHHSHSPHYTRPKSLTLGALQIKVDCFHPHPTSLRYYQFVARNHGLPAEIALQTPPVVSHVRVSIGLIFCLSCSWIMIFVIQGLSSLLCETPRATPAPRPLQPVTVEASRGFRDTETVWFPPACHERSKFSKHFF